MIADPKLLSFLRTQEVASRELAATSDLVDILAANEAPPRRYLVRMRCRGLAQETDGRVVEREKFVVGISFHADYLRRVRPIESLAWLDPINAFHPNIRPEMGLVCIGPVAPATPLRELLERVWDVITWQKANVSEDNALNPAACAWGRSNRALLPIDRRPLRWRRDPTHVEEGVQR